jgi:hypothetical protein
MFQQASRGGDKRRISRSASAVQSALHWNANTAPSYLPPNSESMQKPIGGRSLLPLAAAKSMLKTAEQQGSPELYKGTIYKEAIDCTEHNSLLKQTLHKTLSYLNQQAGRKPSHPQEKEKMEERAKVVKEELLEQDTRFLAVYVETKNSCLIMLSEKEDKLGTMAIAVPKPKDLLGPATSSVLVGNKNAVTARMFAEYVASKKEKIAMVSVYLDRLSEIQAQAFFMHLIEKVLRAESEKEATTT